MTTTPEYDAILARKMKEREIKGNLSSKTMTPEETFVEISQIVPNYQTVDAIPAADLLPKRKRGRPVGSRNKPKIPS